MDWKFWKKEDDFLADPLKDLSSDFNAPSTPSQAQFGSPATPPAFATSPPPAFTPDNHPSNVAFTPAEQGPSKEDKSLHFELILARLDSIKTQLEVLNQRVSNLEAAMNPKQKGGPWYRNQ